jgi:gamma-glutamylcyclotransferase (GGCT)/AIG2-like uncharacterized protein YtfP
MRLLFVYGTLRRGTANDYARRLEAEARWWGEAELRGRLIALGEHRALVEGDDAIAGEVWEVPEAMWPVLDEYEGEEYVRVECEVRLKSGERVRVQVYRAAGGR